MNPQVHVYATPDELCDQTAEKIIALGNKAIDDRGYFTLALAGGKTPKMVYERIAVNFKSKFDWNKVHFFWSDERDVISTHPDSNFGMAKEALLNHLSIPDENIHRTATEEDPMLAAQQVEDDIRDFFKIKEGGFPKFDLVMLGLGDDGHTASLFPGSDGITEKKFLVMDNFVKKLSSHRITFTFPTINHANHVLFLVSGKSKAEIVKSVIQGTSTEMFPAQLVRPVSGELHWYLDKEAASLLT